MTLPPPKYYYCNNNNLINIKANPPQCSPNRVRLLHGKSIPVPTWPNRTHGHSGRQHHSGILGVYDLSRV